MLRPMEVVSISISYYFGYTDIDLDNLAKPMLDGLKGVVIADDRQVVELILRKRTLAAASRQPDLPSEVAASIAAGREFVHVTVMQLDAEGWR